MNAIILTLTLTMQGQPGSPPIPNPPPDRPIPLPPPTTIVPTSPPPMTVEQFGASFIPTPGVHQATIIHPCTKKPIDVVFSLPELPLKKTRVSKCRITYDYGKTQVVLIFRIIGGKVDVRYD